MEDKRNQHIELVAGLWIAAKASTLFSTDAKRAENWRIYGNAAQEYQARYNTTLAQFADDLKTTAARIYANELKYEIFGYSMEVVA